MIRQYAIEIGIVLMLNITDTMIFIFLGIKLLVFINKNQNNLLLGCKQKWLFSLDLKQTQKTLEKMNIRGQMTPMQYQNGGG